MFVLRSTPFATNVARPDGYNSLEKMVSWCGMGWRHILIIGFIASTLIALSASRLSLNLSFNGLIQDTLNLKYYQVSADLDDWSRVYACFIAVVPVGLTLLAVNSFGRFMTILTGLVLQMATLCIFFFVDWSATGNQGTDATAGAWATGLLCASNWWLIQSIVAVVFIYCYEVCPIKFRLPAMLGITLMETLGELAVGLSTRAVRASVTSPSMSDTMIEEKYVDFEQGKAWELAATRSEALFGDLPKIILPLLALAILLGLGVRSDSPASLVIRGRAGIAFDRLFEDGKANTEERIPMTKDEFLVNTRRETEGSLGFRALVSSGISPLALVALLQLAWVIIDKSVLTTYDYVMMDVLEGTGGGEFYDSLYSLLLTKLVAVIGFLSVLALWYWNRDIRFAMAAATLLAAVGAVICSSVSVDSDSLTWSSQVSVVVGVSVSYLGMPLLQALVRVLILDLFTNKSRALGVFAFRAIDLIWMGLVALADLEFLSFKWFFVTEATIVAIIGLVALAGFYCTNWFDRSLICRDPELDAGWLISEKGLERTVVGSRERVPATGSTSIGTLSQ